MLLKKNFFGTYQEKTFFVLIFAARYLNFGLLRNVNVQNLRIQTSIYMYVWINQQVQFLENEWFENNKEWIRIWLDFFPEKVAHSSDYFP